MIDRPLRALWWNYAEDAGYFITICTGNYRKPYFGYIQDGKMNLTPTGLIAHACWHEIKQHAKNVTLGEFVVMPDHVHCILVLKGNEEYVAVSDSQQATPWTYHQRCRNMGKNTVSSIIGSFKSAVTRLAHREGYEFKWQSRFWDHIIRNDDQYDRITRYIYNNPRNWGRKKTRKHINN